MIYLSAILYMVILIVLIVFLFFFIHNKNKKNYINHKNYINNKEKQLLTPDQCLYKIKDDIHNIYKIANFFFGLAVISICILCLYILVLILNSIS